MGQTYGHAQLIQRLSCGVVTAAAVLTLLMMVACMPLPRSFMGEGEDNDDDTAPVTANDPEKNSGGHDKSPPPASPPAIRLLAGEQELEEDSSYKFGIAPTSFPLAKHRFVIRNDGETDLSISSITIEGADAASFSLANQPVPTLREGASHEIEVGFAPTSDGKKQALLKIKTNDPDQATLTVSLTGATQWGTRFMDGDDPATGINYRTTDPVETPQFVKHEGKLYVFWDERRGSAFKIRGAVFNGDESAPSWQFIDGNTDSGLNFNPGRNAYYPYGTSCGGKIYLTWWESDSVTGHWRNRVKEYNGNDAEPVWTFVDGNTPAGLIYDPATTYTGHAKLTCYQERVYAMFYSQNSVGRYPLRVAVLDPAAETPQWTYVDGGGDRGVSVNATSDGFNPWGIVYNDKLYIVYRDRQADSSIAIRVVVYNGNDDEPVWTYVDGGSLDGLAFDHSKSVAWPRLAIVRNRLVNIWLESNADGKWVLKGKAFNGDDANPLWTSVGESITMPRTSYGDVYGQTYFALTTYRENLYVSYSWLNPDNNKFQQDVKLFNGDFINPAWASVANGTGSINRDPTKNAYNGALTVYNGKLWSAWYEHGLFWGGAFPSDGMDQLRVSVADD